MIPFAAPTFGKGSTVAAAAYSNLTFRNSSFDNNTNSTYTFASSAIGTAAANRWVIVGVLGSKSAPIGTITSLTVGGITATELVTNTEAVGSSDIRVSLYIANVPTGTTADIVVTWSSANLACAVGWWTVNMNSGAAHFTGGGSSLASATVSIAGVDVPANSFAIGCAGRTDDDAATIDQSFVERFESTSTTRILTGDDREVTSSFTGTVTWTFAGTANNDNAAVMATFVGDGS